VSKRVDDCQPEDLIIVVRRVSQIAAVRVLSTRRMLLVIPARGVFTQASVNIAPEVVGVPRGQRKVAAVIKDSCRGLGDKILG